MSIKTKILIMCALLTLNACEQNAQNPEAIVKLTELETKITTLESELSNIKEKLEFQQVVNGLDKEAYLTPGSEGYSLIKTDLGNLTVSLVNVLPYANGSKITLQFGNLTSATIDGLKIKLEWGPVDKEGLPINEKTKSRDVVFNESLISGNWTNSDVVLEGIPPTDLGFVKLQNVTHRGVRLRR